MCEEFIVFPGLFRSLDGHDTLCQYTALDIIYGTLEIQILTPKEKATQCKSLQGFQVLL